MGLLNYLGGRGSSAGGEGSSRHVESDVVTVGGVALEVGRSRGGPARARELWRQGDATAQHPDRPAGMVRTSVSRSNARDHGLRGRH